MDIKFTKQGKVKLLKDYRIKSGEVTFVLPKGFVTDGASIPWLLQLFANPFEGDTLQSALIHDCLYGTKGHLSYKGQVYFIPRKNVDIIFKLLLTHSCPKWKVWIYYFAVRMGGWYQFYWGKHSTKFLKIMV